ncbi:MAG: lipid-A-disaccharide synthase [Steroidobacteraceae bacterium]
MDTSPQATASASPQADPSALEVGFVAGESSGDQLGAALIEALRARVPGLRGYGIGGPLMQAAGSEIWAPAHELAVMGLTEPLKRLPRLIRLRRRTRARLLAKRPDVFVGIDAPAFNLGLAEQVRRAGIPTVQYVSPQVWAWRPGRVRRIARACDLVLCLLPFEVEFYARHGVRALFVGHPLADEVPLAADRLGARRALALDPAATVIALLPGSRTGEVERLGRAFLGAARWVQAHRPAVQFVAPMASAGVRRIFEWQLEALGGCDVRVLDGDARRVLAAADAVLVASGTATLEALLAKCPMVAAYRFGTLTALAIERLRLSKVPYFSLPNLLAGRALVPEFYQDAVTPAALGAALLRELDDDGRKAALEREFLCVHQSLRQGGADRAAAAILELAGRSRAP